LKKLIITALLTLASLSAYAGQHDGLYAVESYITVDPSTNEIGVAEGVTYLQLFELRGNIIMTLLNAQTGQWQAYQGIQEGDDVITLTSVYSLTDYFQNGLFTSQKIRLEFIPGSIPGLFSHTLIDPTGNGNLELIKGIKLIKLSVPVSM
jgi:hypothetical protein